MMNLLPHHRRHIPNGLAVFAAVLLLISSTTDLNTVQESHASGQEAPTSVKVEASSNDTMNDSAIPKRSGLNLGLLLFRRG